jgi:integrase
MGSAQITGPHATPKGLRHGFGIAAVEAQVPLHLIQRWLGHAQLSTTVLYLEAVDAEERNVARRMWEGHA